MIAEKQNFENGSLLPVWKLGDALKVNPPQNDIILRTQQFQAGVAHP